MESTYYRVDLYIYFPPQTRPYQAHTVLGVYVHGRMYPHHPSESATLRGLHHASVRRPRTYEIGTAVVHVAACTQLNLRQTCTNSAFACGASQHKYLVTTSTRTPWMISDRPHPHACSDSPDLERDDTSEPGNGGRFSAATDTKMLYRVGRIPVFCDFIYVHSQVSTVHSPGPGSLLI